MNLWYLASPYTNYIHGHEEAFNRVLKVTAELLRYKIPVWSPIAYSHQFVPHGLPVDAKGWEFLDEVMVSVCTGCIIYMMEDWESSSGITHEQVLFTKKKKPIEYLAEETDVGEYANYLKSAFAPK